MALVKSQVQIILLVGLALLFSGAHARGLVNTHVAVFDVTKFGAKPGGKFDCNTAFTRAWIAACHAEGPAKVVIPPGTYMAGEIFWSGPCTGHVTVEVHGTVIANKDISEYPDDVWITVQHVDGVTINGANFKGTFQGSGASTWQYDTCEDVDVCEYPPLPPSFLFNNVKHGDVGYLTSVDSKGYHFQITDSSDVKLHNLNIRAPSHSPHTNALKAVSSRNVGLVDSVVSTGGGKDCVIWGPGTTNHLFRKVACNLRH